MKLPDYADDFKVFALSRDDTGVLTVRMHYRDAAMQWTALAHRELPRLLSAVDADPDNRVMILTGTGDHFISTPTGYGDVYRSGKVKPADWERGIGEAVRMLQAMTELRIPIVAAVNGPVTGHAELVLLCDAVVCTEDTYFQDLAHVPGNLVPGDGVQVLWPMVLGPVRAKHFLLTAQKIRASEALSLGVVGEVVERNDLTRRAAELAAGLAQVDPLVMAHTRALLQRQIRRALHDELITGLGIEAYVSISRFPEFDEPAG